MFEKMDTECFKLQQATEKYYNYRHQLEYISMSSQSQKFIRGRKKIHTYIQHTIIKKGAKINDSTLKWTFAQIFKHCQTKQELSYVKILPVFPSYLPDDPLYP